LRPALFPKLRERPFGAATHGNLGMLTGDAGNGIPVRDRRGSSAAQERDCPIGRIEVLVGGE
jgi:hypothetical protein